MDLFLISINDLTQRGLNYQGLLGFVSWLKLLPFGFA
jgi:hypothetical protein